MMKIPKKNPAQQLFLQFCEFYKQRDLKSLLKLFTKNVNCWGTGEDEYRVGLKQMEEQLKRDWSQSEKGELEIVSFVPAPQEAMWVAARCNVKVTIAGQELVFEDFRGTLIAEKENDNLKISHMHASFPDYRNADGASFPTN